MNRIVFFALFLLFALAARSQMTEGIETDRPDQTESPYVVPNGYFQGEFGFNLVNYKEGIRDFFLPTGLLKYGLTNWIELRLEGTPYTETIRPVVNDEKNLKLEPVEVGAKLRLFEEKGLRPKTSLIAHVGLPFLASKEFRESPLTYVARLTMQHSLSEVVGFGYNIGVERDIENTTSLFYTVAPGFGISDRWYAYVEAFGSFTGGVGEHNLDAGIAYNPSPDTKIDFSSGFGLGSSLLKNYIALGFSFRLPLRRR